MLSKSKFSYFDKIMMAVTFAEANDAQTAKSILMHENKKVIRPANRTEKRPSLEL